MQLYMCVLYTCYTHIYIYICMYIYIYVYIYICVYIYIYIYLFIFIYIYVDTPMTPHSIASWTVFGILSESVWIFQRSKQQAKLHPDSLDVFV